MDELVLRLVLIAEQRGRNEAVDYLEKRSMTLLNKTLGQVDFAEARRSRKQKRDTRFSDDLDGTDNAEQASFMKMLARSCNNGGD